MTLANQETADTSKPLQNASDGKDTEAWLTHKAAEPDKDDSTVKDAAVIVTFDAPKTIDAIVFQQGASQAGDVIDEGAGVLSGTNGTWQPAGAITKRDESVRQAECPG